LSRPVYDKAPIVEDPACFPSYDGNGPWYACLPDSEVAPRMAEKGDAGPDTAQATIPQVFEEAVMKKPDMPALKVERPLPQPIEGKVPPALADEDWTTWTFKQWLDDSKACAKAFVQYGMQPFESVNIWGFNAPEWHIGAMAAGFAGGKCAGLYPTDTPDTAAYKVVHSQGSVVIVEDRSKVDKIVKALNIRGDAKRIKAIVAYGFEPAAGEKVDITGCGQVPVLSFATVLEQGKKLGDDEINKRVAETRPGHCAGLIYTSGTTGEPKAVMISHDSFIYESQMVINMVGRSTQLGAGQERVLSYLPLSHVAGMMVDIVTPVVMANRFDGYTTVYFARPYDLKLGTIKDRLCAARPTLFLGVPLVWEKIADKIRALGADVTGVKRTIADWAKGLGKQHAISCQLGGDGSFPAGYGLADAMVLSKVKANLGLQELKAGFTAAAPIRVDTLEFFAALGLGIKEVYGMSECTGACTWSLDEAHAWGSCGWQMPGVQVRSFRVNETDLNKKTDVPNSPSLDNTEEQYQGELCFRGRNNMMGYMGNPDMGPEHVKEMEKKTADAIDNEGWLHSGDKGMITDKGMVKITGRYKELIIGEGGENIAPVPIEDQVKKGCDGICEVMMIGDKRKYNVAIVTLKAVGANGEVPGTDNLDAGAKRLNPAVTTISGAMEDPVWIKAVEDSITAANNNGKVCPNNAFKIQKFSILPTNFSEELGELTPTKKLKRKVVENKYMALIDKMYKSKDNYVKYS